MAWQIVAGARADDGGAGMVVLQNTGARVARNNGYVNGASTYAGYPLWLDPADAAWKASSSNFTMRYQYPTSLVLSTVEADAVQEPAWRYSRDWTREDNYSGDDYTRVQNRGLLIAQRAPNPLFYYFPAQVNNTGYGKLTGGVSAGAGVYLDGVVIEQASSSVVVGMAQTELTQQPFLAAVSASMATDVNGMIRVRVTETYPGFTRTVDVRSVAGDLYETMVTSSVDYLYNAPGNPYSNISCAAGSLQSGVVSMAGANFAFTPNTHLEYVADADLVTPGAPLTATIVESVFAPGAPLVATVYDPANLGAHAVTPLITLGGAALPLSRVAGELKIEIEEGVARLADFVWLPPSGELTPGDLVGVPLLIDVEHDASGVTMATRLFTGRVESVEIDLDGVSLRIVASDGAQAALDALDHAAIAALLPATYWSDFLFDPLASGWRHAQDRMSTLPASLDLDAVGQWRVTPWAAATPLRTLTSAHIVDGSLGLEWVARVQVLNQVEIRFGYRFPRLALRRARWQWDMELVEFTNHPTLSISADGCNPSYRGQTFPDKTMVSSAAAGSGWTVAEADLTELCYRHPTHTGPCVWWCWNNELVVACDLRLDRRYAQDVTERYTLTVRAPNSVAIAGTVAKAEEYSGASRFPADAWEQDATMAPLLVAPAMSGESSASGTTGAGGRDAADAAILAALHLAQTSILASHRHRVSCLLPFDPFLDVDQTVSVSLARLAATGKLSKVVHTLDFGAARYTSEITLRPSAIAPTLPPVSATPLAVPAPPALPAPDLAGVEVRGWTQYPWEVSGVIAPPNDALDGYISNQPSSGYNGRIKVSTPDIPSSARDALELPVSTTYDIAIPEDGLTITQD